MKSQRQVEREYEKLLKSVRSDDFYTKVDLTNRINCYQCKQCGHITKTKDIHSGVTPFIFRCEKCNGEAYSTFYSDITPNQEPTFEWYRPDLKQVFKMRNKPDELEHILKGGLDYRKIESK